LISLAGVSNRRTDAVFAGTLCHFIGNPAKARRFWRHNCADIQGDQDLFGHVGKALKACAAEGHSVDSIGRFTAMEALDVGVEGLGYATEALIISATNAARASGVRRTCSPGFPA
jgi:hypothetical protein